MREGMNEFLDRLGEPFLFAEEGAMFLKAGEVRRFKNTLPKVLFFLDGKFMHGFDDERPLPCGPGHVMVNLRESFQNYAPPRASHSGYVHSIRVTFNPDLLRKARAIRGSDDEFLAFVAARLPRQAILPAPRSPLLPEWLHTIRRELSLKRSDSRHRVNALLRLALLELLRAPEAGGNRTAGVPLLEKIESFLESQLHRPLTLAEVATHVDRSEEHVARFYRQQHGTTVFRELRRAPD